MQPILIVEDDAHYRQTVRFALEDEGWPVEAVADGRQALDWIVRAQPALVVLDWRLPDLDAQVIATGLRMTHGEDAPILLITADGRAPEKARRVGAFAYLEKPFDLADLVDLVQRGLASR